MAWVAQYFINRLHSIGLAINGHSVVARKSQSINQSQITIGLTPLCGLFV